MAELPKANIRTVKKAIAEAGGVTINWRGQLARITKIEADGKWWRVDLPSTRNPWQNTIGVGGVTKQFITAAALAELTPEATARRAAERKRMAGRD